MANQNLHKLRGPLCLLPDYLIVGAQKSGTSSLYQNLIQHPCVIPARCFYDSRKETRFFSKHYSKGTLWYRAHFASRLHKYYCKATRGQKVITGESTPSYIFHPLAPKRIFETVPQAKQILLLRNPVDRAYSHYQHVVRLGKETLSFEEAIEAEPERLRGEKEKMLEDENYRSFDYMYHSYLTRGLYADQLEVWRSLFSMENILILNSDNFFADEITTYKRVLDFLELPTWYPGYFKKCNVGIYLKMNASTRKSLADFFRPHDKKLYRLIGQNFQWE